jgi:hypothetical protein
MSVSPSAGRAVKAVVERCKQDALTDLALQIQRTCELDGIARAESVPEK